jgi:uncharacterized protein
MSNHGQIEHIEFPADDVDAAIAATKANGGRVVEPKGEIPGMGLWAVVADSEGNEVGLYQGAAS